MVYRTNVDLGVLKLFDQLDALAPDRATFQDGTIGDADHQDRVSDHNPEYPAPPGNPPGQIDAGDYTNDPAHGVDIGAIFESIRQSRDPRVKYAIFNRRIFYGPDYRNPYLWSTYSGTDPHILHGHLSVRDATCNQDYAWSIGDVMTPAQWAALQTVLAFTTACAAGVDTYWVYAADGTKKSTGMKNYWDRIAATTVAAMPPAGGDAGLTSHVHTMPVTTGDVVAE